MEIVFLLPDIFGGVFSVVNQYARYLVKESNSNSVTVVLTSIKENPNKDKVLDSYFPSSISVVRFSYSKFDNRYFVYKKLSRLVPNKDAVVVCNDFLEIYMLANIRLSNPCFFILHGDYNYYYKLAKAASSFANHLFCVNPVITEKVRKEVPEVSTSTLRFLVEDNLFQEKKFSEKILKVIFIGRVSHAKGFDVLVNTFLGLQQANIPVQFTIVGSLYEEKYKGFLDQPQITYIERLSNEGIHKLLVDQHVFFLPSRSEGYPVTIVEAMKAGVLPLVNDIPAMAPDILLHNESGIRVVDNQVIEYQKELLNLNQNRQRLKRMSENAFNKVNTYFNNYVIFEEFVSIIQTQGKARIKKTYPVGVGRSKLDNPFTPNKFTYWGRLFIEYIKNGKCASS